MAQIEDLAEIYARHIATPWQSTVAGAQKMIMVVYDKEFERVLRARKAEFETRTHAAGHDWHEVDVTAAFATWLSGQRYRDAYFSSPEKLRSKLDAEFEAHVAERIRATLTRDAVSDHSVVAVFGVASLFGFARMSEILKRVEADVRGRLVVFFPGQYENYNYRLLDARDDPNYMAVPITLHGTGSAT